MGYFLSKQAEKDILNLFLTGAREFGTRQAVAYHQRLEEAFEFLARHPEAAPERSEISPPVRLFPVKAHLVVYRIHRGDDLFIIRVCHRRQDWINNP